MKKKDPFKSIINLKQQKTNAETEENSVQSKVLVKQWNFHQKVRRPSMWNRWLYRGWRWKNKFEITECFNLQIIKFNLFYILYNWSNLWGKCAGQTNKLKARVKGPKQRIKGKTVNNTQCLEHFAKCGKGTLKSLNVLFFLNG